MNEISYPDKLEILHEDTKTGKDAITQNDSKVKSFDSDNSYDEFPEYTTPSYDLASTPVINLNCSGTYTLYSIQYVTLNMTDKKELRKSVLIPNSF